MFSQFLFDKLMGPTRLLTDVANDPSGAAWTETFLDGEAYSWPTFTYNGAPFFPTGSTGFALRSLNYYSRADCYAAFYKMGGYTNTDFYDRMVLHAQYHFDTFYEPNRSRISPFDQMNKEMALLYAALGTEDVLNCIAEIGNWNRYEQTIFEGGYSDVMVYEVDPSALFLNTDKTPDAWQFTAAMDPRTKARALESFVLCHMLNAPYRATTGGLGIPPLTWEQYAAQQLEDILATQDPTGSWRECASPAWGNYNTSGFTGGYGSVPGGMGTLASPMIDPMFPVKPFESGLMHDALSFYYDNMDEDPRIVTAIEASMDYLYDGGSWSGNTGPLWVPAQKGFKYVEFAGGWEGYSSAGDRALNSMILQGASFLYRVTGSALWKSRAEDALSNVTNWSDIGHYETTQDVYQKLLNQHFSRSYKAWPDLYGESSGGTPSSNTGTLAPTETTDTASIAGRAGTRLRLNWA
jgi:hypothetical protein